MTTSHHNNKKTMKKLLKRAFHNLTEKENQVAVLVIKRVVKD